MIGHYLLTLTPEQEDRVLTRKMRPGGYYPNECQAGCLVGTVLAYKVMAISAWMALQATSFGELRVEKIYDGLCERFGEERVNAAIRNRILSNRARRTLRVRELVG